MNKYKKLIQNSAVFAIGNLGSNLISIILVPLYTYFLTTNEYGMIDIATTTISMLLPITSLSIYDSVLRFVMDKEQAKDDVLSGGLFVTIVGMFFTCLLYPILTYFNVLNDLLKYMFCILALQSIQALFAQFCRAVGEIKLYAANGILMTLLTCVMNIILIVVLKLGITGYLLSIMATNAFSILFFIVTMKIYKYININRINKKLIKKMLIYCVPLIPNAFSWWIINASNRYFILFFIGASANGLFAVASKIPSLLSILYNIFFQAWQLSAIEEYDSESKSQFYSKTFRWFAMIMFIGTSVILVILKSLTKSVMAAEYYLSWRYVPFLLLGVVFSSFSGFLGTNYIAAKKTKGVFRTTLIGGLVNLLSNFIFVPLIGTNGAGLATMISFLVIWIIRVHDTRQFIAMKLDINNIVLNMLLISSQILVLYINLNSIIEISIELIIFLFILLVNKTLFISVKDLVMSKASSGKSPSQG